jgi:hypothetical protein
MQAASHTDIDAAPALLSLRVDAGSPTEQNVRQAKKIRNKERKTYRYTRSASRSGHMPPGSSSSARRNLTSELQDSVNTESVKPTAHTLTF